MADLFYLAVATQHISIFKTISEFPSVGIRVNNNFNRTYFYRELFDLDADVPLLVNGIAQCDDFDY